MGAFANGLANLVAAVWVWALLTLAFVIYTIAVGVLCWRRGRYARGRAVVLAAMEMAASETIAIPRQVQGSDR